ncbi:putative rhoGEF domain containing protein [Lyophyllum shimeji]|uniref:RhoGEF domain containing protein n=1 Tax=Lyophyllum shimeji TaxID=47721 RepID=A0A9P3PEG7_LYOSH|nr:putative rhoGEF domain containing protein [Lyophyllum shimeji]
MTDSPERTTEDISAEGSWSDHESSDSRHSEKARDDIRKYHALKELLDTEVGYLLDLRALVTVYLRILPTLVCRPPPSTTFSRASSSFTSSPWANSCSQIHAAALSASSATVSDTASPSPSSSQSKEPQKPAQRYLFTSHEVEALTRNAEEILQLHEQFVRELRTEMTPLGFHMESYVRPDDVEKTEKQAMQNTDAAIRVVSTKFATEASRFSSYQSFCAGHPEALDLVRKVTTQHPLEWDAFEHRCSSLVSELKLCTAAASDRSEALVPDEFDNLAHVVLRKDRSRSASMSSVEGAVRTLRPRASNIPSKEGVTFLTEALRNEKGARLAFVDYLIKPVQRICKYPLILDQLKPGKSVCALFPGHYRSDVDVVVESATQAMRHVASAVDEARHRQDVAIQSSLIASRISLASPTLSQMASQHSSFQSLTHPFLSSLGTCLLAGSLDVIHDHASKPSGTNVTAKYLGAFLYLGGYLILVKVSKGKVYVPKQWFALADFEVLDVDEADAMLPCSIRLSSQEHRFELAAACQREKDAWLSAIRESRNHKPSWIDEPTSSLRFDGKGDLIPSAREEGPFEPVNGLPTIQSIPELSKNVEHPWLDESLVAASRSDTKQRKSPRQDFGWRQEPEPPSRRSSTASVKGIFSPMSSDSETIVIRRYSASARSRVDQGLQDVISQPCLTARSYAGIKDEELFQAPKVTRSGFVRSQSGLSMAGMAKSRLTRHESVRVLRRKSLIDKPDVPPSKKPSGQSLMSRRQLRPLTIAAMPESVHQTPAAAQSPGPPSPFSMTSMASPTQLTAPSSPVRSSIFATHTPQKCPNQTTQTTRAPKTPMKTSRSLVNGVKDFFQSRSSSSTSLNRSRPDPESQESKKRTPSSITRWAKASIHRRTRSAPDVPEELLTLPNVQRLPALDFGTPISLTRSREENPGRSDTGKPPPQQSLPPSTILCHSPAEMDTNHGPTEHTSILQRLKV